MGVVCLRKIEEACLVRELSLLIGERAGWLAGGRAKGRVEYCAESYGKDLICLGSVSDPQ